MKHHQLSRLLPLYTCVLLIPVAAAANLETRLEPSESAPQYELEDYRLQVVPGEEVATELPELPDVSQYSRDAVEQQLAQRPEGAPRVSVQRIGDIPALGDFVDQGRAREWVIRQYSHPKAILVDAGRATLDDVYEQVGNPRYMERNDDGSYTVRLPLVVQPEATLVIREETLRLSEERGAFMANDGWLFVIDSTITGWREKGNGPATFIRKSEFRPFFVSWGGSETFVLGSTFQHLGYNQSKSYGFTVAQYSEYDNKRLQRSAPEAWLVESTFSDIYYGFYCYEAENVAIVNNVYHDNIVYGIDPHDYSSHLLIAGNEVYGTREKHGIIISREVNDSWIINNHSYENGLSGIVLDRQSRRNVVARNLVHDNQGDGIGLYESPDNLLWENRLMNNLRNGIRVRNSTNVRVYNNVAALNGTYGVLGQVKDLSATDRNFEEDFYHQAVSMTIVGGNLAANASGPLASDNPQYLELYDVNMRFPRSDVGIHFEGLLGTYQTEIFDALLNGRHAVRLTPNSVSNNGNAGG
ncbi:right-handed parallel beta-helix repeat-containing protein [Marinobacter sp.]|uniref:right-handed parallel beta-helix repeat-containing protein n=1 Tax=Marinobacter sp. TaxID=50741 RepID=UPI0035644912